MSCYYYLLQRNYILWKYDYCKISRCTKLILWNFNYCKVFIFKAQFTKMFCVHGPWTMLFAEQNSIHQYINTKRNERLQTGSSCKFIKLQSKSIFFAINSKFCNWMHIQINMSNMEIAKTFFLTKCILGQ